MATTSCITFLLAADLKKIYVLQAPMGTPAYAGLSADYNAVLNLQDHPDLPVCMLQAPMGTPSCASPLESRRPSC